MTDIKSVYVVSSIGSLEGTGKLAEIIVRDFSQRTTSENLTITTGNGDEITIVRSKGKFTVSLKVK